jgi:hypothetical protein
LALISFPKCPLTNFLPYSYGYNSYAGGQVIPHTEETDLKYAMRASGGSFGIVTEFAYKMYPKPETLSCLLLVFIENEYDFKKLNKAAQVKKNIKIHQLTSENCIIL